MVSLNKVKKQKILHWKIKKAIESQDNIYFAKKNYPKFTN